MARDLTIIRFIDARKKNTQPKEKIIDEALEEILSQVKEGTRVVHSSFGQGQVISIEADLIHVDFGLSKRKFLYPQAFVETYLQIIDT